PPRRAAHRPPRRCRGRSRAATRALGWTGAPCRPRGGPRGSPTGALAPPADGGDRGCRGRARRAAPGPNWSLFLASNRTLAGDRWAAIIASHTGTNVIEANAQRRLAAARRSHPMEALIALFVLVAALAGLDVLAVLFGADSRDEFADDCLRATL